MEQSLKITCERNPEPDKTHKLIIIKGSGKKVGIPLWKCQYCKTKTQSS